MFGKKKKNRDDDDPEWVKSLFDTVGRIVNDERRPEKHDEQAAKADRGEIPQYTMTFSKGIIVYSITKIRTALSLMESEEYDAVEARIRQIFEANPRVDYRALERSLGVRFVSVQLNDDRAPGYRGIVLGRDD